jgi:head-tail adaptor
VADQTILSSGQLDRLVVLQRKLIPSPVDSLGGAIDTWQNLCEPVWAQKLETGGTEDVRADELAAQISATFIIRFTYFSPMLNPRDRLLFNPDPSQLAQDGLAFNIRRVIEVGRRAGHRIDAWARADQLAGQG